jgi:hypothetical protein
MRPCPLHTRRGTTLLLTAASLLVLVGVLSLCVDWGVKNLVDAEVQAAADAAAKAGAPRLAELATALTDEHAAANAAAARAAAIATGEANPTTGDRVSIRPADVEVGIWDDASRTFAPSASPLANAVRVSVERSDARGNSIRTSIGRALGIDRLATRRGAVAKLTAPPPYALVGLDHFRSMGVLTVDGSPLSRQGHIASNGDVTLNLLGLLGVSLVDGHVSTLGSVRLPWLANLTMIRDGVRRPELPFVLPLVSLQAPTRRNATGLLGDLLAGDGDLVVAGVGDLAPGVYNVDDLTVLAGALLRVGGPTTIYVRGRTTVLGTVLSLDDPERFRIRVVGSGPVTIAANVTLSADIYAPESPAYVAAGVVYRGRLMTKSIDVLGTSLFFLRPDLPPPELGRPRVTLVD